LYFVDFNNEFWVKKEKLAVKKELKKYFFFSKKEV